MKQFLILFISFFALLITQSLAQTVAPTLVAPTLVAPIPMPPLDRNIIGNTQAPTTPNTPLQTTAPIINNDNLPAQLLTLSARISENGSIISNGLVWRVFKAEAEENGEMVMLAKSEDSIAKVSLKPGNYIIHASYGRAQASETIRVEQAPTNKTLTINSGALRLNAAIIGDIAIRSSNLSFDIYANDVNQSDPIMIAKGIRVKNLINLNAGVYKVISHFGNINSTVSADLKVEPGQITDATLYHNAAQVSFKLVSEVGGRAIADVDWKINTPEGKTIFTSINAFPATILDEGEYVIIAKRGRNVYNRDFSVQAGPAHEIEVLISVY